jgi:hypothetical protein
MFIPDPDICPSRIPDLGSKNSNKREGWNKICCHTFFHSHKFYKIVNYFVFEILKKKIWVNFQSIIVLFTQKTVIKLSKIWVWDPGSEIGDPEKTYSGSWIQGFKKVPDLGSATLINTIEKINTILIFKCHLVKKNRRHTSIIKKKMVVDSIQEILSESYNCVCKSGFFVL